MWYIRISVLVPDICILVPSNLSGHKCLSVNLYRVWTLLPAPSKRRKTHSIIKSNSWEDWQSFYRSILATNAVILQAFSGCGCHPWEVWLGGMSVKKRSCSNTGILVQLRLWFKGKFTLTEIHSEKWFIFCFSVWAQAGSPTGNKHLKSPPIESLSLWMQHNPAFDEQVVQY